jgi:cysteine desulfurase
VIYADYNSTTPCLPEVVQAVAEQLARPGNPAHRLHPSARQAQDALEHARDQLAQFLGADAERIVFTSGATESCNLAIFGVASRLLGTRPRFVYGATEHPAVVEPHRRLRVAGAEVMEIPVDAQGRLDLEALRALVTPRCALVSVMAANNETGVISDIPAISAICHAQGALMLCDATAAVGRIPLRCEPGGRDGTVPCGADFLACSGHKLYAPAGVGALWIRRGLSIEPLIAGGGQERGLRGGTPNLPGIVGFGVAAHAAAAQRSARSEHLLALTRQLEDAVTRALPEVVVQGQGAPRAPGTSFFTCPDLPRGWLAQLRAVAASGGSSCSSGTGKASTVLLAMGVTAADAANSIRISWGVPSTTAEVDAVAADLIAGVRHLRGLSAT